jgi:hypothetical protein
MSANAFGVMKLRAQFPETELLEAICQQHGMTRRERRIWLIARSNRLRGGSRRWRQLRDFISFEYRSMTYLMWTFGRRPAKAPERLRLDALEKDARLTRRAERTRRGRRPRRFFPATTRSVDKAQQ